MKIKSIYIASFGKLKDLTLEFSDGFNVILGDNEKGKTTLMAFIRMMFYGSERGGNTISKNIRKKYTPWDNSQMAGSIDFEHNSKNYRLEKEFHTTNSTDKTILCDLDFGTRTPVQSDVGASFFGLSLSAFERSVFIGQFGYPENDTATEGEFSSKLSNIASTGEEAVSLQAVCDRILKARYQLISKTGKTGEYSKNLVIYQNLAERIKKSEDLLCASRADTEQIALEEEKISELKAKAFSLKEKLNSEQDIKNAAKLKKLLELKTALDNLNETLKLNDGSFIDELYLKKLQFCISKLQTANDKVSAKASEIELLNKSIEAAVNPPEDANEETLKQLENEILSIKSDNLSEKIGQAEQEIALIKQKQQTKKSPIGTVLLITGILMLFSGIITGLFVPLIPLYILAVLGALSIVSSLVVFALLKKQFSNAENDLKIAQKQLEILRSQKELNDKTVFEKQIKLETIKAALNNNETAIKKQQELLNQTRSELDVLKQNALNEEITLRELFSRYRKTENLDEIFSELDVIAQKATKQKEIKTELNFLSKDLNGISYLEAEQKLNSINQENLLSTADFETLKQSYENTLAQISEKSTLIAALTAENKTRLKGAENPEVLKPLLKNLEELLISQKEFCDAADIASSVLAESAAELHKNYGSALDREALSILNSLTDNEYTRLNILKSFDITVEKQNVFGGKEIDYLSSGTADQIYLSLRLALSKLICSQGETLPILLDDSLAQYDDERLAKAIKFLNEYSKNNQIIMFTCHKQICDIAKDYDCECINL